MMQIKSSLWLTGSLLCLSVPAAFAQQPAGNTATAPDNTKVNKRDRAKSQPTADQAKENRTDRELMQQIRKSLVGDKSLSTYAKNVKVIAENGKVTLKGPVHTEEERSAIEAKAAEVAGAGNVTNQLSVKADSKTSK